MIKELIVVEGKNDAQVVRRALGDVDIIWTEGYGLSMEKINYIREMAKRRGVIVFTDPDTVGEQIRNKIGKYVPNAKHVYISQKVARKKGDIGVENSSIEEIRRAFASVQIEREDLEVVFDMDDLVITGLAGGPHSAERRSRLGRRLGIGDTNAKQFLHRLNRFGISRDDFLQAVKEEEHGNGS
ncbi:MAG: ribonuclease M5 [Desulfitobacterium hafniense]|nr:ribonuclease M5 [Desulfitobacterium hafniense]